MKTKSITLFILSLLVLLALGCKDESKKEDSPPNKENDVHGYWEFKESILIEGNQNLMCVKEYNLELASQGRFRGHFLTSYVEGTWKLADSLLTVTLPIYDSNIPNELVLKITQLSGKSMRTVSWSLCNISNNRPYNKDSAQVGMYLTSFERRP
jgi:hypothetical protein